MEGIIYIFLFIMKQVMLDTLCIMSMLPINLTAVYNYIIIKSIFSPILIYFLITGPIASSGFKNGLWGHNNKTTGI